MSKTSKTLMLLLISGVLFAFALHPITTFDTFFGLKIGEGIVTSGSIPQTEPFSWSAQGRPIIAYEWLAQVWVYILHLLGELPALEIYVAVMFVAYFLVVFSIFRVLGRSDWSSIILALFTSVSVYDFFVARPQIIAFLAFVLTVYLLFAYLLHNKNWLYLTIPIMYIWTNSHASFVIGLGLWLSYIVCAPKKAARTFAFWGGINFLVTLLPPLGGKPYLFLWDFSSDLPFMTKFISEWAPLSTNLAYQFFYSTVVIVCLLLSIVFSTRSKRYARWYIAAPFILISLFSFQAIRHVPLGIPSAVIVLGLFAPEFSLQGRKKYISIALSILCVVASIWMVVDRRYQIFDTIWNIPSEAADRDMQNILAMDVQGNMFNEFAVGGYLLYYLYPKYQIFFDGRADVYHCCEMRDYWKVIQGKRAPQAEFDDIVKEFLEKYQFSYLIIPTYSYNPMDAKAGMMVASVLQNPDWRIIYFSDLLQIVVKNDGKNQPLFDNGFTAVTPYGLNQWRQNQENEAFREYTHMITIADSAIARNALGDLYISQEEFGKAEKNFRKALELRSDFGRSRVGLAKIAIAQGDQKTAISELKLAIKTAPYWGEAYVLLGKIYLDQGQKLAARNILETGLKQNIDFVSLREIAKLLNSIGVNVNEE